MGFLGISFGSDRKKKRLSRERRERRAASRGTTPAARATRRAFTALFVDIMNNEQLTEATKKEFGLTFEQLKGRSGNPLGSLDPERFTVGGGLTDDDRAQFKPLLTSTKVSVSALTSLFEKAKEGKGVFGQRQQARARRKIMANTPGSRQLMINQLQDVERKFNYSYSPGRWSPVDKVDTLTSPGLIPTTDDNPNPKDFSGRMDLVDPKTGKKKKDSQGNPRQLLIYTKASPGR